MIKGLLVGLFFASGSVFGFEACLDHFPGRTPPSYAPSTQLAPLCFEAFAVLHSGQSKTPVFAVTRMNRSGLIAAKAIGRADRFYEEARLPKSHRATLADYRGSGYDRGHLVEAAAMATDAAMAQSFSLANIVPQAAELNRGVWAKRVEAATRQYVSRARGDVFVFTGPVFSKPVATIGPGQVWVPSHLFKLVYDPGTQRAWAYWVANTDAAQVTKPITYRELTDRIGLALLANQPVTN